MSLFKSSIIVSILSLLISVISFSNQVVIAGYFGTGNDMDVYLLASSIPLMMGALISSALSYSLIPHFIIKKNKLGNDFKNYFGQFIKKNTVNVLIITSFLSIFYYFLMPKIYTSLTKNDLNTARLIGLLSWLSFAFSTIYSIFICFFNAQKKFKTPLLFSIFPFVFSIFFTIVFYDYLGIIVIVIGIAAGNLTALLVSFYITYKELDFSDVNKIYNAEIFKFVRYLRFPILAMLSFSVYQSIDAFWATKIGVSALSYLGYSQRIIIAMGALVIAGPSIVLIPHLTESIQNGKEEAYFKDSSLVIKLVMALSSVIAIIAIVLAKPIVQILFQRGVFDHLATDGVSYILSFLLIGMVFMLSAVVAFRALFVREMGFSASVIGISATILYFILSGILSKYYKIEGIGIAYIVTWIFVLYLTIIILFFKNEKYFFNSALIIFLFKQTLSLIIVWFMVVYFRNLFVNYIESIILFKVIVATSLIGLITIVAYLFLSIFVFKIEEVNFFYLKLFKTIQINS